ncbi:ABC transporter ATP-binding protein [Marinomonas mediterranea]|jgi:ABC-type cobalamin/Fe3+-siderophores transport systems, ATPase components|uniref:Phosphonate-transporting ATPase n=1 Tax=Marinomonas mediterranea (strain ATCC 700492 / JCM 21426 / NBRC 103028 / MMB-1) TaxID=717774 RepID=F2JVM7_MARM1|nr:ABC transporter ATP-binding protein [Marinomonas mediterranea]ADZ90571.1 Phosphonate-transporting ATPase [Marinomonas mediterranea MMB-1]WCN08618.1 ATP-binding cassette domain-containing protein [Marinomonas mediterranea]WCN12672.1 ATP-binding cassette domain-containing protein [Marinomonas mediterranea]WCN16746.1 ATP-binding cassette domain-containing protein [Marinomonas mediterranea MMB-1]
MNRKISERALGAKNCLSVRDLHVKIDQLTLAKGMSFDLCPGEVTVIIGPNGTGKSTLLKTLFGDINKQQGEVSFQGISLSKKVLSKWRQFFGYMPQDIHLDVELSVLEVVLLGQLDALSLRLDESMVTEALNALEQIGLLHLANRSVNALSGGQCQMILFAQAMMRKPSILMLDEPVSALDLHFQQVLLDYLDRKTKENGWVSLMVLHDLNLAAQYADNLLVVKDGLIVSSGAPKDILTPQLVKDVYGVEAEVTVDGQGVPFIRTRRSSHKKATEIENRNVEKTTTIKETGVSNVY